MTAQEFDYQFDVLYNNITSNQAPGLDAYEKSVFLTKAQDEIIKNYFLAESNPKKAGFDDNQKRQTDFSKIVVSTTIETDSPEFTEGTTSVYSQTTNSHNEQLPTAISISLPNDLLFLLNAWCEIDRYNTNTGEILIIKQISTDEYDRLRLKPFPYPRKKQAWGILSNSNKMDIITGIHKTVYNVHIRYIKKPTPIILETLTGTLQIDGQQTQSNGSLSETLHQEILQRAVELAKIAWANPTDNTQLLVQAGIRSE